MNVKIESIQWCRAIAILAVLGFHIFPDYFPNGFLGVDVFFVISGYLITMIMNQLLKDYQFSTALFIFYSRRIKRIFPNYFLTILFVVIVGFYVFHRVDFEYLRDDASWSMSFSSNIKEIIEKNSYFQLTSDYKPLLHTWSLAVEIQFYLIAPLLILLIEKVGYPKTFLFIVAVSSFLAQLFVVNQTTAFNFMFCRLWQFLIGSLIFYFKNNQNDNKMMAGKKYLDYIFFVFLVLVLIFPYKMDETFVNVFRFLATILASQIIVSSCSFGKLNSLLLYVGDISYTLYLVHWPVIIFCNYLNLNYRLLWITALITVISVLQHHFFENQLQKFSFKTNSVIIVIFIMFTVIFVNSPLPKHPIPSMNIPNISSLEDAIKYNEKLHIACQKHSIPCQRDDLLNNLFKNETDYGYSTKCMINYRNSGKMIAILAGNSFMARHSKAIVEALNNSKYGGKFEKIYILSQTACPIFKSTNEKLISKISCPLMTGTLMKMMKKLKPDLFVSLNRLEFLKRMNLPLPKNISTNAVTMQLRRDLEEYANLTKNVVIIEPHFIVDPHAAINNKAAAITLMNHLSKHVDMSNLTRPKTEVDRQQNLSWTRMKVAAKTCKNCHILETMDLFCNEKTCDLYDKQTNLAYFCDTFHFTEYAASKIIPKLTDLFNKLIF